MVRLANKPPWYTSLFVQLLVAIVAGILIGWLWPEVGGALKPLADGFIKLIKMLIAPPIIFCTVVLGIAHVGDLKSVGRIGGEGAHLLRGGDDLRAPLRSGGRQSDEARCRVRHRCADPGHRRRGGGQEDQQRRTAAHRPIPAQHHPDVGGVGLRGERPAAGVVLRGAVRPGVGEVRGDRAAGDPGVRRPHEPYLLHHHRLGDAAGPPSVRSARWPTSSGSTASAHWPVTGS